MLDTTFTSKRFLKINTVALLKTGILLIKKSPFESLEIEISYEQLEPKRIVETKTSFGLMALFLFLIITGILFFFGDRNGDISIVFFLLSLIVGCAALLTKLKVVSIKSFEGHNIELYFTNGNKAEVLEFADMIITSINTYLLKKYSKIDKDLPIDKQLSNLNFLRQKDLITDEIFEQLKNQLLGRENKQTIGYR